MLSQILILRFVCRFFFLSLPVSHVFGDGATPGWGVAGKDQEEETFWRGGSQSAVAEPGLSRQLHAWRRRCTPRSQTGGELRQDYFPCPHVIF